MHPGLPVRPAPDAVLEFYHGDGCRCEVALLVEWVCVAGAGGVVEWGHSLGWSWQ